MSWYCWAGAPLCVVIYPEWCCESVCLSGMMKCSHQHKHRPAAATSAADWSEPRQPRSHWSSRHHLLIINYWETRGEIILAHFGNCKQHLLLLKSTDCLASKHFDCSWTILKYSQSIWISSVKLYIPDQRILVITQYFSNQNLMIQLTMDDGQRYTLVLLGTSLMVNVNVVCQKSPFLLHWILFCTC